MSTSTTSSRRYAQALLEAAGSSASSIADELDSLVTLEADSPESWEELVSPTVPAAAAKATIDRLFAAGSPLTRNLLKVLVDNRRLDEATDVAREFRRLVREQSKQLDVHVTTAVELTDDVRTRLEERLSASTGQQVTLHASVDPDIIGGLVVRHGDTLVDTSLKGRLEQLRVELSRPTSSRATS